MLNVCFDIDGVLCSSKDFFISYGREYFKRDPVRTYGYWPQHFFIDEPIEEIEKNFDPFIFMLEKGYCEKVQPNDYIDYLNKVLQELKEKELITCMACTNRLCIPWIDDISIKYEIQTKDWINKYIPSIDKICFNHKQNKITNKLPNKNKFLLENKVNVMIEDEPNLIKTMDPAISVIVYRYPYNDCVYNPSRNNMYYAKNLAIIADLITSMSNLERRGIKC